MVSKEEIKRKLEAWKNADEESRIKYIKTIIDYFYNMAKKDKLEAWKEFNKWLVSDEGAIVYPYFWKPEYRDLMNRLAHAYLLLMMKIGMILQGR